MLREFQDLGLGEAVVDLGQLLLLFTDRRLGDYEFSWSGQGQILEDKTLICAFRQTGGSGAVTIFERRQASQELLQGEVWFRETDLLPLRVVLHIRRSQQGHVSRHEAAVDYVMSRHGALTPETVVHREYVDERLQVENLFRYTPFRMFSAEAQIEFKGVPPAPARQP
jgi:hypothetical protein